MLWEQKVFSIRSYPILPLKPFFLMFPRQVFSISSCKWSFTSRNDTHITSLTLPFFKGCVAYTNEGATILNVFLPSDTDVMISNMSGIQTAAPAFSPSNQDDMDMSYNTDPRAERCSLNLQCCHDSEEMLLTWDNYDKIGKMAASQFSSTQWCYEKGENN